MSCILLALWGSSKWDRNNYLPKKSSYWIDSNHISKLTYKDAVSGYAECKEDKISVRCVRRALTGLGLWVRGSLGSDL